MLPLVLYNGVQPWGAASALAELIVSVPGGLDRHRPPKPYLLVDEQRCARSGLVGVRNPLAAVSRLERRGSGRMYSRCWSRNNWQIYSNKVA